MRRALVAAALAAAVAAAVLVPATSAGPGPNDLLSAMNGTQESPPGDPDGHGAGSFEIRRGDRNRVCFRIIARNIAPAAAGHIHAGRAGQVGDIVVPLFTGTVPRRTRCVTVSRARADSLLRHPGRFYVNVHNGAFPGGAIRGQLSR